MQLAVGKATQNGAASRASEPLGNSVGKRRVSRACQDDEIHVRLDWSIGHAITKTLHPGLVSNSIGIEYGANGHTRRTSIEPTAKEHFALEHKKEKAPLFFEWHEV
ncbi:MAG: hypothetical protein ACLQU2_29765 [Candidatus Binataceae bacterium]